MQKRARKRGTMSAVRATSVLVGWIAVVACSNAPPPSLPPHSDTAFVSPDGDDAQQGTRDAPFRTVARALVGAFAQVVLLPGIHFEGPFVLERPVLLEGEPGAALRGTVRIVGERIRLRGLDVAGAVEADGAAELVVETTTISGEDGLHALRIIDGTAELRSLELECGSETCLYASGATVTVDRCRAIATSTRTARIFRFQEGRAVVRRARLEGGAFASLQIQGHAHAIVEASELAGGSNGLVALDGASLEAEEVVVTGAAKIALLLQDVDAQIRGGRYDGTRDLTVGISGAEVVLIGVSLGTSDLGVISISRFRGAPARVELEDGTVQHGARSGVLIDGSRLTVRGTRFFGEPNVAGDDGITARGPGTQVTIEDAAFEEPSGFAVGLYDRASGVISASVVRPGLGGILLDAAESATVADSTITGCAEGSGVVVQDSGGVLLRRLRVEGCSEAGVLGIGGSGAIRESSLVGNQQFGAAAFAGGRLSIASSTISGSPFATFATCADGARVDLLEGNRISGLITDCP